ncbi:MAG: radical SAM protein, partial [Candidatus Omnitrophica bacterium]|nr:radical SAM protein [Candidatus Omnitrophota bacterium]
MIEKPKIDYLRISVTDRCNMRCIYCIPKAGIVRKSHGEILTLEEILRLVRIFASVGIKKIRLTGGEPLVRRGIVYLINSLVKIEGVEEVLLTTNGMLLPLYAQTLKSAGIKRVNISLDTLSRSTFQFITNRDYLNQVLAGIKQAKEAGLQPIKLNTVIMKGINENEITDFVEFALSAGLILRFIEFMPVTPLWREDYYIPIEAVKDVCD